MIKKRYFIAVMALLVSFSAVNIHMNNYYNNTIEELENEKNNAIIVQNELKTELNTTQEKLQVEIEKNEGLSKELGKLTYELSAAHMIIEDLCSPEYEFIYIGEFKITAYCSCIECCGYWATIREYDENGNPIVYTASGAIAQEGVTIAVDTSKLPYGSEVYIGNHGFYVAEDCGGGVVGNHIDVYYSSHDAAKSIGVQHQDVWVLVKKS